MTQTAHIGSPPIPLHIRRQPRARRYTLRISARDGSVSLTIPRGGSVREGLDFAKARENWLRGHLVNRQGPIPVTLGMRVPLDGTERLIAPRSRRGVVEADDTLLVGGAEGDVPVRLQAFLKLRARDRMAKLADMYARQLGKPVAGIRMTDARTRWGSCAHHGGLMFSWRLIMAPHSVQDYVAAHEVAHLAEMNHSPRFWAQVDHLCPGYEEPRQWLRNNGAQLHRFDFSRGVN